MGPRSALGLAALVAGGAVALHAAAWRSLRSAEDLDPQSIDRPGGLCFIDGVGLHVVDQGSGPALLMVHGFAAGTHTFREQIAAFSGSHRVIAVDLPGFGYSEQPPPGRGDYSHTGYARLLAQLMDRLGIAQATVMGHSLGGAIATRFAALFPERVDRLILVCAAAPFRRPPLPPAWVLRACYPLAAAALNAARRRGLRTASRFVYDPSLVTDEVREMYRRPWRMPGTAAGQLKLVQDSRRDAPFPLSAVQARTLVLWGEADRLISLRTGQRLHAGLPDARLEVIPRAGHLVLEEQPAAANAVIRAFLAQPSRPEDHHA